MSIEVFAGYFRMRNPIKLAFITVMLHIYQTFFNSYKNFFIHIPTSDLDGPFILTPYLKNGRIEDAREDTEIHLEDFQTVTSYSGFFTVDEENKANGFFGSCPSKSNYTQDPMIVADLLNYYRVFIYNGQLDITCAHTYGKLSPEVEYFCCGEYSDVEKNSWRVDDRIAGSVKMLEIGLKFGPDLIYNLYK